MNLGIINCDNEDSVIFEYSSKFITQIVDKENKATLEAILKYCEKNNIIPNLIDKEKLDLVLRLGIQELQKRELDKENNNEDKNNWFT